VDNGCPSSSIAVANVNNIHPRALRHESCHDGILGIAVVLLPSTNIEKRNPMGVASCEEKIATFTVALDGVKKKLNVEEERRTGVEDELRASKEEIVKFQARIEDLIEEDGSVLPTKEDNNKSVDERPPHRLSDFWAEFDAKLAAELARAKAVADLKHAAELHDTATNFDEKVKEVESSKKSWKNSTTLEIP